MTYYKYKTQLEKKLFSLRKAYKLTPTEEIKQEGLGARSELDYLLSVDELTWMRERLKKRGGVDYEKIFV